MKKGFLVLMVFLNLRITDTTEAMDTSGMDFGKKSAGGGLPAVAPPSSPSSSGSGFFNNQCPFYDEAATRFNAHIDGLKTYLQGQAEEDKKCRQAFSGGNFDNLRIAMNRYNQLMGLSSFGGGMGGMGGMGGIAMPMGEAFGDKGGMMGGMGMPGGSRQLTCFNVDQYYKEEAEKFLITAKRSSASSVGQDMGMGMEMGMGMTASPFDACTGKIDDELESCVVEQRVGVVADAKTNCAQNEKFQRQKAELQAQVDEIQKGSDLLKKIIENPDCKASPAIMQNVISLGTEVASISTPGLGGVFVGALGGLIGTLVDSFTSPSAADKALKDIKDEDHFNNTACLFNSFQNEIYNCKNRESAKYGEITGKCYEQAIKNPRPLGGLLTDWFQALASKLDAGETTAKLDDFFKTTPIGSTDITYDSVVAEAKNKGCEINEDKKSASQSYEALKKGLECLTEKSKTESQADQDTKSLPKKDEINKLQSKIAAEGLSPAEYQKLFATSKKIPSDLKSQVCSEDSGDKSGTLVQNEWFKTEPTAKAAVKEKYQKLLYCLESLASYSEALPKEFVSGSYFQILAKELEFQRKYIEPYHQFQTTKVQAESTVPQSIKDKFSRLVNVIKDDSQFKNHLNTMSRNADDLFKSNMKSDGQSAMTSTLPFFKACLHMNAMSFLKFGDKGHAEDLSSVQQSRQSPFENCEKFKCLLPKPEWGDNDNDKKVAKLQAMACTASQTSRAFENKLEKRLKEIRTNPSQINKGLDGICGK